MNNGLTVKRDFDNSGIYDIHLNETACSGFGGVESIALVLKSFFQCPTYSSYLDVWDHDTYLKYKKGHTVFMPMCLVGWDYE